MIWKDLWSSQREISDIKKIVVVEEKFKKLSAPVVIPLSTAIKDNSNINDKLTNIEDRSRRNNLRINRINEHETPQDTESNAIDLFRNKLYIKDEIVIEREVAPKYGAIDQTRRIFLLL